MPNVLDANGLQVASQAELTAYFTAQFQSIYGSNVVLTPDSPDGQFMNIIVQKCLDVQDLVVQVYTSMDPDQAFGTTLDQRVAINGVKRQAGTYTVTPITVVVSQSVNLYGLDQTAQPVFTVADSAGVQWQLQTTQLGLAAGSHALNFQAAKPGAVPTIPNTITVPSTIVLGVTSVNNPTSYTSLGVNEESDVALRIRRQKSVSLPSQGFAPALRAALKNISGVTDAFVFENNTAVTNSDGVPQNSIWVVVAGTGAAADVANAIYTKRNGGCGMYGSQSYVITQLDGTKFPIYWDNVVTRNLFIFFSVSSIDGVNSPNIAGLRSGLPVSLVPGVNQPVNANQLSTLAQQVDPNTLASSIGFSDGTTQSVSFSAVPTSGAVTLSYNGATSGAINWNDSVSTIQTTLRAVTGLSQINVTGGFSSQVLSLDLSQVGGPQGLLTVASNTLLASATPVAANAGTPTLPLLTTPTKKNQFVVSSANIVILPMQLTSTAATATHTTGQATFTGLGGYGAYTYSMQTNNSGGTVNASTGVYTAGTTPNVTDTVKVTDALGNTATATISVT